MSERQDFCVYGYFRDGRLIYVGKGQKKRFSEHTRRGGRWTNKRLANVFNENGSRVTGGLFKADLSERAALELEALLIAAYGREDTGTGSLYNFSAGGDGKSGFVIGPNTRTRISKGLKEYYATKPNLEESLRKRAEAMSTPEARLLNRNRAKAQFQDPAIRKVVGEKTAAYFEANPSARQRISDQFKNYFSDPANRKAKSERTKAEQAARKAAMTPEEYRAYQAKRGVAIRRGKAAAKARRLTLEAQLNRWRER